MDVTRTSNLRRQHDAAIILVEQICRSALRPPEEGSARALALTIAKLTGLLQIHFAQEDKALYPYMMSSTNEAAARTARAFQAEMGDLASIYMAFAARWASGKSIVEQNVNFRVECERVFGALRDRISRENEELYPLADAIRHDEVRRAG